MKTSLLKASAFAFMALIAVATQARDLSLATCPLPVQDALLANCGSGKVEEVKMITQDGLTQYVAKVNATEGHDMKVFVAEDGTFLQSRQEIPISQVSPPAQAAMRGLGGHVKDVTRIIQPGGITYDVKWDAPDGPDQTLLVAEDGTILGQVPKH